MQVRMVAVATGTEIRTSGITWFDENRNFIINTKLQRYTFTNISVRSISELTGTLLIELQGTTQVFSGTGDAPELYYITLQHGF